MPLQINPTETEALDRLRFSSIVRWILSHEGGYVNDPEDPGGETNFGISKRSYPTLDIRALTIDKAAQIYYLEWWKPLMLHLVDDDGVAAKILDTCVNCGKAGGVGILRRTLIRRGHTGIKPTGAMEMQVVDCINKANIDKLLLTFCWEQVGYYIEKVIEAPFKVKYLRGWYKRAQSIYVKGE